MFERTREWILNRMGYSPIMVEAPATKRDPKKIGVKRIGAPLGTTTGNFEQSAIDLTEMSKAYNSDSYVKRAVDKYAGSIFKEGWEITGKDDAITTYIWTRLKLMSEGTGKSTDEFLKEIGEDLVLYGNAFVAKARQKSGQGGVAGIKAVGYTGNSPIAAYFVLPPTTVKIKRDPTGKVTGYEQDPGGGTKYDIKPEDMIHFYFKKPRGRAFGVPYIFAGLDDVKILRNVEENIARLIYRNLFPLYQYQVGLDKPGFEATDDEIEYVREQIREMPMDGGIVVSERHNISVVSNASATLNAEPYLKYFRQRVFTALGVSDIVMGIGDTANRGTADNLSAEMIDGVKEFQAVFKNTFVMSIINELLFEGGYDPILNPDQEVDFVFTEIELDAKIKKENHAIQKFTQNSITHEELRIELGMDPVQDESRLYFNMITIPVAVQTAEASAQASADNAANNAGSNKNQPANQHGKKPSPGKPKRSKNSLESDDLEEIDEEVLINLLTESAVKVNLHSELRISQSSESLKRLWNSFRDDTISMIRMNKTKEEIQAFVIHLVKQTMQSTMERDITTSFYLGLSHGKDILKIQGIPNAVYQEIDKMKKIATRFTDRLASEMKDLIFQSLTQSTMIDKLSKANGAFDSNEYRIDFIATTEIYRAYNYALAQIAKVADLTQVTFTGTEECKTCQDKAKNPIDLSSPNLLDAIPPHHPNCTCIINLNTPVEEV